MRVSFALLGTAFVAVMAVSGLRAAGEADVLFVSSLTLKVGQQGTVLVEAELLAKPGLGAWTLDISYDNTVVTATECIGLAGSVCNPVFDEHTVRVTGASASGLTGTNELGTITFLCGRPGESPLMLRLSIWGNAIETDQRKVEMVEGSITCTEPPDLITISSFDLEVGRQGTVRVEAERVAQPGVGAWTLDISYDASVVSFLGCEVLDELSECSGESAATVHVRGASAEGLQPGTVLAELEFRCDQPGATDLRTEVKNWSVAGIGFMDRLVDVEEGRVLCGTQLPSTGVAEPRPGSAPATVPLAVLGTVLVAAALAFRRYASAR
ncbi:MAG: hypothetical protein IIC91_09865 [Chloroflexi bacterium]|nr:hypothetical protein [Chloroflexota bacterium]